MFTEPKINAARRIEPPKAFGGRRRLLAAGASLAGTLILSACGGGGDGDAQAPPSFNIGVTIGGQPSSYIPIALGGSVALAIRAGQSFSLDSGEPVVWNMYIAGTQVSYGAQIIYAGVTFDTFNQSPYAVTVNTYAPFFLPNPVDVTLVATSTYDSFQVATLYLTVVN